MNSPVKLESNSLLMTTKMIAILSFALLLGSQAVHGDLHSCFDAKLKLEVWPRQMVYGDPTKVERMNFDHDVDVVHIVATHNQRQNSGQKSELFIMRCEDTPESHCDTPKVIVEGASYELLSLNIISTDADEGTAGLQVTFVNSVAGEARKYVSFLVPLLGHENAANTNTCINKELLAVAKSSKYNTYSTGTLRWLSPLLDHVVPTRKLCLPGRPCDNNHMLFLTDCEHVQIDALRPFLKPNKEMINPAFFFPQEDGPLRLVSALQFR